MIRLGWKGPYTSRSYGMARLEGSLRVTEPQYVWVGRDLKALLKTKARRKHSQHPKGAKGPLGHPQAQMVTSI